jgi:GMP synthase (glutamine-hydrolysing)
MLLYKTGETAPELVRDLGDYFQWFSRLVGDAVELARHFAFRQPRPCQMDFDALLVTGSPCSLVDPEPWMEEATSFVREVAESGRPVLGICFGHQLIGRAWGGAVRVNPNGWEAGTTEIELTDEGRADPLFDGLPAKIPVNMSHRDEVCPLGPGVRRLAGGARCENQAIAVGDHVRGVQFHPEMNGAVIKRLIAYREPVLRQDAARRGCAADQQPDALIARSGDTPLSERVVKNFIRHFINHA